MESKSHPGMRLAPVRVFTLNLGRVSTVHTNSLRRHSLQINFIFNKAFLLQKHN